MWFKRKTLVAAGVLGTVSVLASCWWVDRCGAMGTPEASACTQGDGDMGPIPPSGEFQTVPLRVSVLAPATTVNLSLLPKDVALSITIKKDGKSQILSMPNRSTKDGTLKLSIPSLMMAGFTPGKAQIEVTIDGNPLPKTSPLWLYREASFKYLGSLLTPTTPRWVGVGNNRVYAISDVQAGPSITRQLNSYSYSENSPFLTLKTQLQSGMRSDASAGITDNTIVLVFGAVGFTDTYIVSCSLKTDVCNDYKTTPMNPYGRVQGTAAARSGSLYAVVPETPTDRLDVYAMASELPTNTPVALDQPPAAGVAIKVLGFGLLDTDRSSDLFVWQFTSGLKYAATVYLQDTSGLLKKDAKASASIQALLGNADVDALTIADLDMDGLDDIAFARGNTISIHANQGDGTWSNSAGVVPVPTDILGTDKVTGLAVGQLNADGLPDLVISSATSKRIGVYTNQ